MQAVGGERTELVDRLAHRRQAWADVPRGHDVVPADDGDITRHVDSAVLQPVHDRQCELVVGADEGVGGEPGEDPVGEGGAVGLLERDARGLGRRQARGLVGSDEAVVPVADVGSDVGVADEEQPAAPVLEEVAHELLGAVHVLGADGLDPGVLVPGDEHHRLAAVQRHDNAVRDRRGAQHRQSVDAGGQLPYCPGKVLLALRQEQDDALAVLGGAGLEAEQELGVVRPGELGQDESVGLVVAHGQAAGGAEGHVVQLLDSRQDLLASAVGDRGRALQHPGDGGDGDAGELGDGVDRRPVPSGLHAGHRSRLPR